MFYRTLLAVPKECVSVISEYAQLSDAVFWFFVNRTESLKGCHRTSETYYIASNKMFLTMSQVIKCRSWSIKYHSTIIFIIKSPIFENLLGSEVIGFRG